MRLYKNLYIRRVPQILSSRRKTGILISWFRSGFRWKLLSGQQRNHFFTRLPRCDGLQNTLLTISGLFVREEYSRPSPRKEWRDINLLKFKYSIIRRGRGLYYARARNAIYFPQLLSVLSSRGCVRFQACCTLLKSCTSKYRHVDSIFQNVAIFHLDERSGILSHVRDTATLRGGRQRFPN